MRNNPSPVPPITHNGIRYEAPHWRRSLPIDPGQDAALALEEGRMQATMVNAMARGGPADLSPDWVRSTLLEAGHQADLVDRLVDKMVVHRKLQEALISLATSVTRLNTMGTESDTSPLGYATPDRVRPLLERGGLTPTQIDTALEFLENQKSQIAGTRLQAPQDGGYLLALEESTGRPLWCVQVYNTSYSPSEEKHDQDVFITELRLDGDRLLVLDESGRTHSVDLAGREVKLLS